jgi:hypothetical protein
MLAVRERLSGEKKCLYFSGRNTTKNPDKNSNYRCASVSMGNLLSLFDAGLVFV